MTPPSGEEAALADAAIQGDSKAWSKLVEHYAPLVWSVARGCGLSSTDAQDVSQTVFVALVRRLPHLQDPSRISGWIVVCAKRESWRVSAQNRRGSHQAPGGAVETDAPFQEPDIERLERQQAVRASLGRLNRKCRDLLMELFSNSTKPRYSDVAQRLGLSPNSVGPTRKRCLQQLMEDLQETSGETFSSSLH